VSVPSRPARHRASGRPYRALPKNGVHGWSDRPCDGAQPVCARLSVCVSHRQGHHAEGWSLRVPLVMSFERTSSANVTGVCSVVTAAATPVMINGAPRPMPADDDPPRGRLPRVGQRVAEAPSRRAPSVARRSEDHRQCCQAEAKWQPTR